MSSILTPLGLAISAVAQTATTKHSVTPVCHDGPDAAPLWGTGTGIGATLVAMGTATFVGSSWLPAAVLCALLPQGRSPHQTSGVMTKLYYAAKTLLSSVRNCAAGYRRRTVAWMWLQSFATGMPRFEFSR